MLEFQKILTKSHQSLSLSSKRSLDARKLWEQELLNVQQTLKEWEISQIAKNKILQAKLVLEGLEIVLKLIDEREFEKAMMVLQQLQTIIVIITRNQYSGNEITSSQDDNEDTTNGAVVVSLFYSQLQTEINLARHQMVSIAIHDLGEWMNVALEFSSSLSNLRLVHLFDTSPIRRFMHLGGQLFLQSTRTMYVEKRLPALTLAMSTLTWISTEKFKTTITNDVIGKLHQVLIRCVGFFIMESRIQDTVFPAAQLYELYENTSQALRNVIELILFQPLSSTQPSLVCVLQEQQQQQPHNSSIGGNTMSYDILNILVDLVSLAEIISCSSYMFSPHQLQSPLYRWKHDIINLLRHSLKHLIDVNSINHTVSSSSMIIANLNQLIKAVKIFSLVFPDLSYLLLVNEEKTFIQNKNKNNSPNDVVVGQELLSMNLARIGPSHFISSSSIVVGSSAVVPTTTNKNKLSTITHDDPSTTCLVLVLNSLLDQANTSSDLVIKLRAARFGSFLISTTLDGKNDNITTKPHDDDDYTVSSSSYTYLVSTFQQTMYDHISSSIIYQMEQGLLSLKVTDSQQEEEMINQVFAPSEWKSSSSSKTFIRIKGLDYLITIFNSLTTTDIDSNHRKSLVTNCIVHLCRLIMNVLLNIAPMVNILGMFRLSMEMDGIIDFCKKEDIHNVDDIVKDIVEIIQLFIVEGKLVQFISNHNEKQQQQVKQAGLKSRLIIVLNKFKELDATARLYAPKTVMGRKFLDWRDVEIQQYLQKLLE
jgi:hypothetical protein